MSPVFTQEFVPNAQSQLSSLAPLQDTQGSAEAGRVVRVSFTALGLALSLGASGSLISSAAAADSMQLAALPSVTGAPGTLPSFGSSRPDGASAIYHTVSDGETIWDIAKQHGVTVEDIKAANSIGEEQVIQAGQVLKVPAIAANLSIPSSPAIVVEPQEDTANSPGFSPFEAHSNRLEAATVEDVRTEAQDLSEFLTARQLDLTGKEAIENDAAAPVDATISVTTIEETNAVALLPDADPVQPFAAQIEFPAKPDFKPEGAETRLRVFQDTQTTHRVDSGDTVWSIARRYGIETNALQEANGIANPDLIITGDELVIPADEVTELAPDENVEHLSRHHDTTEYQVAAIAPVIEKVDQAGSPIKNELVADSSAETVEALAVGLESQNLEVQAPESTISDPFVEGLLSDVAAATQSQVDVTAAAAERYGEDLALESSASEQFVQSPEVSTTFESTEVVAVNPQFAGDAEANLTIEDETSTFQSDELLAVAPLGSEIYSPVIENPAGRIVSPEMPVLPSQEEYLPEAPNRFEGYIWPAQGVLTSGYGWRWGRMHRGVDIAGPVGTPIYAAAPGVVVKSGWNSGGYGNMVDIRHPDGSLTRYAHNSRLLVNEGQEVRQGQQIAEMGSTGYSTGPHLHFEIHIPNQGTINPIAMLPGR